MIAAGITNVGNATAAKTRSKHEMRMAERGYKENRYMAEYSYNKELEQWNRQNQYDTPETQMARLKAAGLNPNLVYGKGIQNTSSGQLPKYNAPTANYSGVSSGKASAMEAMVGNLGAYLDLKTKEQNLNNMQTVDLWNKRKSIGQLGITEKSTWDAMSSRVKAQLNNKLSPYQLQMQKSLVDQAFQRLGILKKDNKHYGWGKAATIIGGAAKGALGFGR